MLCPGLDEKLAEWVRKKKSMRQCVSRSMISNKALSIFQGTEVKVAIYKACTLLKHTFSLQVSNGWLSSFMNRHNFSKRRQQEPEPGPSQFQSPLDVAVTGFLGISERNARSLLRDARRGV